MQFSMRVAKTLCEEGVESKQRSPNKRRRGEEAAHEGPAGQPVAECKLVDFTVTQGEPEYIERGGKRTRNTTPQRLRRRCSCCNAKTNLCCAAHSSAEVLVPICNDTGCIMRHAYDSGAVIQTKFGNFRATRV